MLAYQALAETGRFERIRIFERDSHPGGNWHYSDEIPASVPIARGRDSDWWKADFDPSPPETLPAQFRYEWTKELEAERRAHRQPKPIWKSLKANTPAPQQEVAGFPWPPGVEWASPHWDVQRYLRSFASWLGLNSNDEAPEVSYNTRVETITENGQGWKLVLRRLVEENGTFVEDYWSEVSNRRGRSNPRTLMQLSLPPDGFKCRISLPSPDWKRGRGASRLSIQDSIVRRTN